MEGQQFLKNENENMQIEGCKQCACGTVYFTLSQMILMPLDIVSEEKLLRQVSSVNTYKASHLCLDRKYYRYQRIISRLILFLSLPNVSLRQLIISYQRIIKSDMEHQHHPTEIEYLFVLDFEATCLEDKKIEPCPEIIEFPVVVVHAPTGKIMDKFHEYVKPRFNPILSKFCTELTGITQAMVQDCRQIEEVLIDLESWFSKLPYIREDNFTFVTCGDWDLSSCLKNEAKQKRLAVRPFLRAYINIKKYFDVVMKTEKRVSGMMEMLQVLGIKHEGKHHSGIDDVLNICNICVQLVRKHGATFPVKEVNRVKYYVPAEPDIEYLLVLDFEATCIKDSKIQPCPEIIQFPVVAVDIKKREKVGQFHRYLKPKYNPQLTQFCTELTGITQNMIKEGKSLEQTLEEFDEWLKSMPMLTPTNFVFVTCGDWDFSTCLRLQAKCKGIKARDYFRRYINIKKYFFRVVKVRERVNGMMDMLKVLGLKHEGRHHSGIDDVINICNICIELIAKNKATFPRSEVTTIQM